MSEDKSEFELPDDKKVWLDFYDMQRMQNFKDHKTKQLFKFGFCPIFESEEVIKEYRKLIQEDDERFFGK